MVTRKLAENVASPRSCTKNEVDAIASAMLDERRQLLAEIWEDCDVDLRSDLAELAAKESNGIPLSELSDARQRALEQRGLGTSSGNRMRASCRLMASTKPTALLLDSLQSIGDFGQHRDDFRESTVTKGFAACVILCAIELVESLAWDLLRGRA